METKEQILFLAGKLAQAAQKVLTHPAGWRYMTELDSALTAYNNAVLNDLKNKS